MSQEDDLRGLAKVMDFMRALSVLFVVVNIYWFCYPSIREWNVNIGVVDRILLNFQRTTGLFGSILWTKLFSVTFLALSCLGTKGVKEEKIKWVHIWTALCAGVVLFFFNWWLLCLPVPLLARTAFYIFTCRRLPLPARCRCMDLPPAQTESHGRCVQQRERKFHAGNKAYRK